jgi:hypothetical protein
MVLTESVARRGRYDRSSLKVPDNDQLRALDYRNVFVPNTQPAICRPGAWTCPDKDGDSRRKIDQSRPFGHIAYRLFSYQSRPLTPDLSETLTVYCNRH